jgi:hypothetical protein
MPEFTRTWLLDEIQRLSQQINEALSYQEEDGAPDPVWLAGMQQLLSDYKSMLKRS